ncbi:MAG: glycosyltransferase family 2 protein [Woeseiaceae bacterium]
MKNISVAVIVLTHNNLQDTLECLDSVSRLRYSSFEIVLVDNYSTDGSIEEITARHAAIHYVRNAENLGVAGGRNSGWHYVSRHFSCDYLFFLDNDTVVHPGSLSFLVQTLEEHPEVGIVCGKTYTAPPSETIMSVGLKVNLYTGFIADIGGGEKDEGQYENAGYVSGCGGFAFLTRATLFRELNGLANEFNPYGWEDVDLSFRALKTGFRCYYDPRAVIYHKGCKIGRGYIPLYEKYKVKHYFLFLARHTSAIQKLTCSIIIPFRVASSVVNLILRGNGNILFSHLSGAFESVFKKKRLQQQGRNSPP